MMVCIQVVNSGELKNMFEVQESPMTTFYVGLSILSAQDAFFYRRQAKMKWSLSSQAFCSLNEETIDFFYKLCLTESSPFFWKCDRNSSHRFCVMVCPDFWLIIVYLSTPNMRSLWSQWVVMAACHCHSLGRGQSDILCATLIMLWLHRLYCYFQVVEISLQFLRYMCITWKVLVYYFKSQVQALQSCFGSIVQNLVC
jgi:hypothetical protein